MKPINWKVLETDGYEILSVMRLSDKAVFKVGGYYTIDGTTDPVGPIDKLWQSFEQMRLDVGRMGMHIDMPIHPVNN
jgi:hypothetical protein